MLSSCPLCAALLDLRSLRKMGAGASASMSKAEALSEAEALKTSFDDSVWESLDKDAEGKVSTDVLRAKRSEMAAPAIERQVFRPTLYVKKGCPFCAKVQLFLVDCGCSESVDITERSEETDALLLDKCGTSTYPVLRWAEDEFLMNDPEDSDDIVDHFSMESDVDKKTARAYQIYTASCLLYTSPSPRDATLSRMPSSA